MLFNVRLFINVSLQGAHNREKQGKSRATFPDRGSTGNFEISPEYRENTGNFKVRQFTFTNKTVALIFYC